MISKTTKISTDPVAKAGDAVCLYAMVKGFSGILFSIRSVGNMDVAVPTFVGVVASAPFVLVVAKK
jgi:hypothetical protein